MGGGVASPRGSHSTGRPMPHRWAPPGFPGTHITWPRQLSLQLLHLWWEVPWWLQLLF